MKNKLLLLFCIITAVYFLGVKIPVMDVDAAQYASMSREMLQRGDFLHVYDQGKDYLDKPPFTFWICSASMAIFGVNNFADKFPSILFALLAIFCTYQLTLLFYKKPVAVLSAIVLATCQATFLITQDCRTDTILMGWVSLAIWQLAAYFERKKFIHLIIGSIAIGLGMLTKGPIALVVPILAFAAHFALRREWKQFIRPQYLLAIIIIALILLPMSIGLYQQFDLHPEKIVNGQTGVSGLKFFFWTQSFGRITGQSVWNNHAGIFFLLQNMLWAFIPWILFFLAGLVWNIKEIVQRNFYLSSKEEAITTGGFMLAYLSLGLSHYQLPHYIFVVFPLAAIITGNFIYTIYTASGSSLFKISLNVLQYIMLTLLLAGCWLIVLFVFIPHKYWPYIYLGLISAGFIGMLITKFRYLKTIIVSVYLMLVMNIFLSSYFYPRLLQFEWGNVVGHWVQKNNIAANNFYTYNLVPSHSLDFYSQRIVSEISSTDSLQKGYYLATDKNGLQEIQKNYPVKIVFTGEDYPVTLLSLPFLNYKTRNKTVKNYYIIHIQ